MKRVLTGIVGVSLGLAAAFYLDGLWFFLGCALVVLMATHEFNRIGRRWAPAAPLGLLLISVPLYGYALAWLPAVPEHRLFVAVLGLGLGLGMGAGLAVLLGRTPVSQSLSSAGLLVLGTLYFALPLAALVQLQRLSTWVLALTLAVIWAGDVAALYIGRSFGRHKLAPVVSPNKSWEGAVAGLVAGLAVVAVWSWAILHRVDPALLAVGAATAVAAQLGDLVESLYKRGAGIKDSGQLLPGHGGMYDRIDALLFGAPVMLLGLLWIDFRAPF